MADSFLHPIQFPEMPDATPKASFNKVVQTGQLSQGSDISFRKRFSRPDNAYTPMKNASAMRQSSWTGAWMDPESLMHPVGDTLGDFHPSTG